MCSDQLGVSLQTHISLFLFYFLACFRNEKDGTPREIKPDITEFFEKLDVVERCFFNNSQVIFQLVILFAA